MSISITTRQEAGATRIAVSGEVDVSNAPELREPLNQALEDGASLVTVDLSEVPYIDSTGIGVLVGAAHRAAGTGARLVVEHPQANVLRVLDMLGVSAELGVEG